MTSIAARVVFPTGSWLKLRAGFGVKGLVNPEDISAEDLASLAITVNGKPLTPAQFSFGRLEWGPNGELMADLNLANLPASDRATIGISNANGSVALQAMVDAKSRANVKIDVTSTARALIVQTMEKKGTPIAPEDVDARAAMLVANQLSQVMAATIARPAHLDGKVTGALQLVGDALILDNPATLSAVLAEAEKTMGTLTTGSGGGGGGGGGGGTTPSGGAWSNPATGTYTAVDAPFGYAETPAVVQIGATLYGAFDGHAELQISTDQGQTWQRHAQTLYVRAMIGDGTDLYGVAYSTSNAGGLVWKLDTTSGTVTSIDATGLPASPAVHCMIKVGTKLFVGERNTGKVYWKNLNGGAWAQFGNESITRPRALASDGTNVFVASYEQGVRSLDANTASGNWTLLTGGLTDPLFPHDIRLVGGTLYAAASNGVSSWNGTIWTNEAVAAGFNGQSLWNDGTDLVVSGLVSQSFTSGGTTYSDFVGQAYSRPVGGGAWSQLGNDFRDTEFWGYRLNKFGTDFFVGLQRLPNGGANWVTECLDELAQTGEPAAAGGYLWVLDDNEVWRRAGAGGAWVQINAGLPAGWLSHNGAVDHLVGVGNKLFLAVGEEVYTLDASQGAPSWTLLDQALPARIRGLAQDGTDLFALVNDGQVHRIPLAGGTWSAYGGSLLPNAGNWLSAMGAVNGRVFVFNGDAKVLYELPSGVGSWTASAVLTGLNFTDMLVSASRVLVFGTPTDGQPGVRQWDGTSWAAMSGAPVETAESGAIGSDGYYLSSWPYGIYKLPFGSTTWQFVDGYKFRVNAMVFEPASDNLFLLTDGYGIRQTL